MRALYKTFIIIALLVCSVSPAFAENPSLIILGIRSVEGDDDFAGQLTSALRKQATEFKEWNASERAMSLDQMTMAYGCEEVDAACLGKIAAGLKVKSIIYGTCRRNSTSATYDYIVAIGLFNADSGVIEGNVAETLSTSDAAPDALASRSRELLAKLSASTSKVGTITVRSNIQDADVKLDDTSAGQLVSGSLVIKDVEPGQHSVEIVKDGFLPYRESVNVTKGESSTVVGALAMTGGNQYGAPQAGVAEDKSGGGVPKWIPYTLLGVSGAALVGTVVSWVWIGSINNDKDFKDYRALVKENNPGVDMCSEAKNGKAYASPGSAEYSKFPDVQGMCSRGQTLEVLQWVFLGTALVAGGVGAYLLIAHSGSDDDQTAAKAEAAASPLLIRPRVSQRAVGVDALVRF